MTGVDDEPVRLLGRDLGPSFRSWTVALPPGDTHPFVEGEWAGALVVVECGTVELRDRQGEACRFPEGAVLWLTDLGLAELRNPGPDPLVMVAVARCRGRPG